MPPKPRKTRTSEKADNVSGGVKEESAEHSGDEGTPMSGGWKGQQLDPQRVTLLPESIVKELPRGSVKLIRCPHPRTGSSCLFLLVKGKPAALFELNFHSTPENFNSFLIDQTVEKDGRFVTATPFDARFLILDKLRQADKYVEVSDFVDGDLIAALDGLKLDAIASTKEICGRYLAKYDEECVLKWLEAKARRLAKVLAENEIACGAVAKSKLLKAEKDEADATSSQDYLWSAVEILKEYISEFHGNLLEKRLGIIDRKRSLKEQNADSEGHTSPHPKRRKTTEEPTDDYTKGVTAPEEKKSIPKMTLAQKKLAQCDKTGMKSITSFFNKKK
ncbi:ribonuclease H2 subunit B-like [Tropilaelaps mercedesae]|uniref:Ribonuclease H2 subunit B-like n=1 Tax=Tropilaelaps mercedesae TaxID=418985 RepID=A0A1V9XST6_9ACAR|nr:ribonuclease H2 subunit B-like [Tropilaelaps mercedesae]